MKSIFVTTLIFFCSISFSQNNIGYATYKKKMIISNDIIEKNESINNQLKQSLKSMDKVIDKFEYKLVFNSKNAKYSKIKNLSTKEDNQLSLKLANSIIGVNGEYYYDMVNLSAVNEVNDFGEIILILKSKNENKWVLTKESKLINSVTCYKATKMKTVDTRKGEIKREVIAWYNPKISIPAGPDGYFGLPGLVVQVEENNIITYLSELKFEEKESQIKIPTKGKKMTETQYNEYVKKVISKIRG